MRALLSKKERKKENFFIHYEQNFKKNIKIIMLFKGNVILP